MNAVLLTVLVLALVAGVLLGGKPPRLYRARGCTGRSWKEAFPGASKADMRRFLRLFVTAFGYKQAYALRFGPDDRIVDIHRAATGRWGVDGLELESLSELLEAEYRFSLYSVWEEGLTLGALFERTRHVSGLAAQRQFPKFS